MFKVGRGRVQRQILRESKGILEEVGIDWYKGPQNLVHASNAAGMHTTANASRVLNRLRAARGNRAAVETALLELGEAFADRSIINLPRASGF